MTKKVLRFPKRSKHTTNIQKNNKDGKYYHQVAIYNLEDFLTYRVKDVIINYVDNKKYVYNSDKDEFIEIMYRKDNFKDNGVYDMLNIIFNDSNIIKVKDIINKIRIEKYLNNFENTNLYYDYESGFINSDNGIVFTNLEINDKEYITLVNSKLKKAGLIRNKPCFTNTGYVFRLRDNIPSVQCYSLFTIRKGDKWMDYTDYIKILKKCIIGFKDKD